MSAAPATPVPPAASSGGAPSAPAGPPAPAAGPPAPATPARPLVLTADQDLLDDLLRLAAAGGAEPEVADHVAGAVASWRGAPFVLVGWDLAADVLAVGLPRRPSLVLVGTSSAQPEIWRQAVSLGAEHVAFLPEAERWLVERFADSASPRRGRVLAVVGARGGAGATSFAVALSLAAARAGRRTMLVDLDPFGGGVDLAFGAEAVDGPRWADFVGASPPASGEALANALPRCGEVTVLSWSRDGSPDVPSSVVSSLLSAARRGADVVVVDLPRTFDEACRAALGVTDAAVVVCPAEFRAAVAAERVVGTLQLLVEDVRLVVRGPSPTGLTGADVAEAAGVPLAAWLDPEPELDRALDEGRPPGRGGKGPLATVCTSLLADLVPDGA
ncbi:MAG TPA: septum site-determining protein Ssd [Frankiaceae bacterium]|jgi:secretion/DNA translocation related CpaE-like protein|nr:septum site-determining protein Ssd [Frankiaceae bacterium]